MEGSIEKKQRARIRLILQIAAGAVLLGRAFQQLVWDIPIRAILWDEVLFGPIAKLGGWDWDTWVSSLTVDWWINTTVQIGGVLYLVGVVAVVLIRPHRKWTHWYLGLCSLGLMFLAILYTKERFFHLGQLLEYSLQIGAPLFLIAYIRQPSDGNLLIRPSLHLAMRLAIVTTFTAHGLYAIGYYPRPGNFLDMMMAGFGVGEKSANQMLWWAGVLDFVCSALILLPFRKWQTAGLAYALFWGTLTTFARIEAYLFITDIPTVLNQWLYQAVYRFPHFLIPLVLVLVNTRPFRFLRQ